MAIVCSFSSRVISSKRWSPSREPGTDAKELEATFVSSHLASSRDGKAKHGPFRARLALPTLRLASASPPGIGCGAPAQGALEKGHVLLSHLLELAKWEDTKGGLQALSHLFLVSREGGPSLARDNRDEKLHTIAIEADKLTPRNLLAEDFGPYALARR